MAVSIYGITGTVAHGNTVTITGANFDSKATAAPVIWDNCSGTNILDKWDFIYNYNISRSKYPRRTSSGGRDE